MLITYIKQPELMREIRFLYSACSKHSLRLMCKTQINSLHLELTISLYLLTVLPSEVRVAISQGSKSSNPCSPIPLTIAPRARADIPLTSGTGSTRDFFRPGMILARYGERSYRRTNKTKYFHAGDQIL